MADNTLFQEPQGADFLVLGDFDPPLSRTLLPHEVAGGGPDPFDAEWGSFVNDWSDPDVARDRLEPIEPERDPLPEPGVVPDKGTPRATRSLVERGVEAVRARTRRLYAEGLPVVFGPAPAEQR